MRRMGVAVVVVGVTMLSLSWQVTLLCLALFPILLLASRLVGDRLAGLTRAADGGQRRPRQLDDRALQRRRRDAAQALRPTRSRRTTSSPQRPPVVRDLGDPHLPHHPDLLRRADARSPRSPPRWSTASAASSRSSGTLTVGTLLALGDAAAPAARAAAGPLQRPHRRDDRAGQLRAGLRGARPALADPGEARRRRAAADRLAGRVRPRRVPLPARRRGLAGQPRGRRPHRVSATPAWSSTTSRSPPSPAQMVALVGPSGAGKTTITHLVARLYDVDSGAVRVDGHDVRDVTLQSLEDAVGYVTQDAHMFHDTIRANLLYARPAPRDRADLDGPRGRPDRRPGPRAARRARHRRRRPRLPALRRRAAAARDRPAAAQGAARSWSSTRPPPTSTPSPRSPVQRALDPALEGRTSLVIAHRLSTVRNADLILVVDDGRSSSRARTPTLLAEGGLYADLYAHPVRDEDGRPAGLVSWCDGPRTQRPVYVVTGGGRGLGRATADALVADGARVVVSGRSQEALDDAPRSTDARRTRAVGRGRRQRRPPTRPRRLIEAARRR